MKQEPLDSSACVNNSHSVPATYMKTFSEFVEELKNLKIAILHEQISRLAYSIWENEGKPEGKDLEFWLRAENKIKLLSSFEQKT